MAHQAPGRESTPLLAYAAAQTLPPVVDIARLQRRLAQLQEALAKDPPPEADCARTLGARRFATMFDDLGEAYSNLGDSAEAAAAFANAIRCSPRAAFLHAELASELLHLGRYSEARAEAERQVAPGRNNFALYALLAQVDFSLEQWPRAIEQVRLAVADAPDDVQATYWQCFLWLAQKRAGTPEPQLAPRTPSGEWPRPILDFLQGRITEDDLVGDIQAEQNERRRGEMLSEALFYAGEYYLAVRSPAVARRCFEATVKLDVLYFIEHYLARMELAKTQQGK